MQLHLILIRSSYLPEGRKSNASSYSFSNSKRQQLKEYIPIHTYMNVYQTGMNYTTFIFTLHFIYLYFLRYGCTVHTTTHSTQRYMYVCTSCIHSCTADCRTQYQSEKLNHNSFFKTWNNFDSWFSLPCSFVGNISTNCRWLL